MRTTFTFEPLFQSSVTTRIPRVPSSAPLAPATEGVEAKLLRPAPRGPSILSRN